MEILDYLKTRLNIINIVRETESTVVSRVSCHRFNISAIKNAVTLWLHR